MFYLGRYEKAKLTLEGKCRNHKGRQIEDYIRCSNATLRPAAGPRIPAEYLKSLLSKPQTSITLVRA